MSAAKYDTSTLVVTYNWSLMVMKMLMMACIDNGNENLCSHVLIIIIKQ